MTAFLFPGGKSLVRSSASAARRAATSRSPFFAWNNSFVMSSAARIAALCVSTIGPCDSTFFRAWSTYATRLRVSGSGLAAGPPPRPALSFSSPSALTARARHPASSSATWRRMVSSWSSTCASALSPSYAKLTLQSVETPCQQRIHVPLAQRPLGIAERAVPGHAAMPRGDSRPAIPVEHLEPLEQRPHRLPQHSRHLSGRDARRHHHCQVPLDRRLQRQRPVPDQVAFGGGQSHLEAEQRSGPHRGVRLEGVGLPHHLSSLLHRHPSDRPARCRFHVTAGGGGRHR